MWGRLHSPLAVVYLDQRKTNHQDFDYGKKEKTFPSSMYVQKPTWANGITRDIKQTSSSWKFHCWGMCSSLSYFSQFCLFVPAWKIWILNHVNVKHDIYLYVAALITHHIMNTQWWWWAHFLPSWLLNVRILFQFPTIVDVVGSLVISVSSKRTVAAAETIKINPFLIV